MQSFNSRMNQTNEFANLSKRCVGVLALPVIPGYSLPLMATSMVLSSPDVDQPVLGSHSSQAQRAIFRTLLGRQISAAAALTVPGGLAAGLIACGTDGLWSRHREWIQALACQAAEQLCQFAGRLGLELNPGNCSGDRSQQQLPKDSRHQQS
jgi:hypothetical protein